MKKRLLFLLSIVLVLFLVVGCGGGNDDPANNNDNNEPADNGEVDDDLSVAGAEYVGSDTCASCHSGEHSGWEKTYHPYMIQEASEMLPEAKEYLESELAKGESEFLNIGPDGPVIGSIDEIDYVVGGFWKQRFAVNTNEGVMFLTAQYNVPSGNMTRYVTDRLYEDRCLACHTTGFDLEKANSIDRTAADYSLLSVTSELGIGCEACHGPGSQHVADFTNKDLIVNPADFTIEEQVNFCGTCHARNAGHVSISGRQDPVGFEWGNSVYDVTKVLSIANNENVWVKTEGGEIVGYFDNEEGGSQRWHDDAGASAHRMQFNEFEMSPHWGKLTCTSCHDVHSVNDEGKALKWNFADSCTSCHGDKYDPEEYMPIKPRSSDVPDMRAHTFLKGGVGVPNEDVPEHADSN